MPISKSTVGRWLKRAALKPHRVRRWLHSPDPEFRRKVRRVVRWYLRPGRRTPVVCVDEKTQVQILERLHPGRPVTPGRPARQEEHYRRHGTLATSRACTGAPSAGPIASMGIDRPGPAGDTTTASTNRLGDSSIGLSGYAGLHASALPAVEELPGRVYSLGPAPAKEPAIADASSKTTRTYPHIVHLRDGSAVNLRLMTAADADRIVAFARSLPEDDLLFLRVDITNPEIVAQWSQNLAAGRATTVIAGRNGEMAGYAALVTNRVPWQRHLGEIRMQVGLRYRSQGLGRTLAGEVFAIGREMGLQKIVAQMTPGEKGAITMFERLGFKPEALLQDYVIDRAGRTRDLVVMTYDVKGLTEHLD